MARNRDAPRLLGVAKLAVAAPRRDVVPAVALHNPDRIPHLRHGSGSLIRAGSVVPAMPSVFHDIRQQARDLLLQRLQVRLGLLVRARRLGHVEVAVQRDFVADLRCSRPPRRPALAAAPRARCTRRRPRRAAPFPCRAARCRAPGCPRRRGTPRPPGCARRARTARPCAPPPIASRRRPPRLPAASPPPPFRERRRPIFSPLQEGRYEAAVVRKGVAPGCIWRSRSEVKRACY